jgi:tetratricopeptide (TPR) repeat protein
VLARRAVELDPKEAMYSRILATAECRAGHWAENASAAERAIKLPHGNPVNLWFILAVAHCENDDKDEAGNLLDRAVRWTEQNTATSAELHERRRVAVERLGRLGSGPARAALNRGIQLTHAGKHDDALAEVREAIRLRPADAKARS